MSMIPNLLAALFEPREPRGYVGKHRAPRMRYVAAVRMPAQIPTQVPPQVSELGATRTSHAASRG
jgi:hypothetical protein